MIDSERGFEKQDANIANIIESAGKPFVIAVNKWDLENNKKYKINLDNEFYNKLATLKHVNLRIKS